MILYIASASVLMVWSVWRLARNADGMVGKILHFFLAAEAGAVLFPAGRHMTGSSGILLMLVVAVIFYHEGVRKCRG